MRIWVALLTLFLLAPTVPDLDAKKSWGGSKRSKSYSRSKRSVRKGSSFDQARSKKLSRERSSSSYKQYKAKKEAEKRDSFTSSRTSSAGSNSGYSPSGSAIGAGVGATTGMAVASTHSSQPQEVEIEYEVHNHYYGDSHQKEQIHSEVSRGENSSSSGGFPSLAVILIILVILGVLYFILSKKSKENRKRVKEKLPIDLRMGAIVDLTAIETRLIVNRENYHFTKPETLKGYVTSIGEVVLDEDMKVYNLYISKTIDEKDHIFYIKFEIYKNRISNIKLFIEYEEVNPSTVEEWEEWLDGTEDLYPYIGGLEFSTPDGIAYERVWERGIEEVVRSKFIEKFSIDGKDIETLNMATLYDRKFKNSEVEYLYLLNIEDSELNNFIRIDLGIEIEQSELQIL